jgi:RHS repeat-associated protein
MSVDGWSELPLSSPGGVYGFGGQSGYYRDPETELYLMGRGGRGRYYDPATGRFTTEDPSGLAGGDANLYRYLQTDPQKRFQTCTLVALFS